ncbi:MAG TPA: DNA polymerase III subunit alpha [Candidatus Deferrimicrobium sp.]|nr:DNA polymerase III subunit alpha [Candidatus Deferrimicrobium sp.]
MKSFIHLHLHSQYSLLDSSLKIGELVKKAVQFNMPAVAMTDHGNILGALNFYKEARKNKIKPIIGSELYVAPDSRFSKPDKSKDEDNYHHLVVLVKNKEGYRNLCELISLSFTEGFYRKPRVDKEILQKYHEGLVALSACIHGEIPRKILHRREQEAYEAAKWYRELFKDDFYIEIQDHGLPDQLEALPKLITLSKELSIPLVASNDVHYLSREDADVREILICLQTNEVLSNPDRGMKKETDEMYFKSAEEMQALFKDVPEALSITMDIASKCNYEFELGQLSLPSFKVPADTTVDDYFEAVCRQGFERLKPTFTNKKHPLEEYRKRLDDEIEKIRKMKFPGYFLIVWDIIRYARENGIPVGPGRGSVVGSLVAHVMGITGIDPLQYDLIFERFLNPERVSMPDIDIDFDGDQRDKVIKYIREKYGEDSTAQIVTFGKMKAKMAIRDIGRVLEIPLNDVNKLAKMIPEGPKVELGAEIANNPELQKEIKHVPETKKLIDYALKLENTVRHTSMHAAGVVIAPKRLTEFMPLYKTKEDIVTQFEKDEVEEIGLLKMDILGLKTLTIIKKIIDEVKEIENIVIDLDNIPLNDEKTFKVFQDGDTDGIFQFESSGMREYLKRSKPDKLTDLIALNALYRPGPLGSGMAERYVLRKLGKEKIEYLFDDLKDILEDTYGIILYQEQVMRISVVLAGFSMSKADEMRKIMGKKLVHKLPAIEKEFVEGAAKKGHQKKNVENIFSQMATFAEYGFNKSHSTAYAYLAYQTAYLKAHYPVYFMSAHLSSEAEKTSTSSKVIQYISEARKMGIEVLPPDIGKSMEGFRVETRSSIRFGLKGLKNVGSAAICSILESRAKDGPFKDYSDFVTRIDLAKVNKAVLESLIKSGAMSSFHIKRRAMFESVEDVIHQAGVLQKHKARNQRSLFASGDTMGIVISPEYLVKDEWTEREIIKYEKEITGMYITHNPLEKYREEITKVSNTSISKIEEGEFNNEIVKLGGVITDYAQRKSKKGAFYGELFFQDLTGRMKILAFKDTWAQIKDTIKEDYPYYLEGRLPDNGDSSPNIYLEQLTDLEDFLKKKARKIVIKLNYDQLDECFNENLKERLTRNMDTVPYLIMIKRADGKRVLVSSNAGEGIKATLSMKKDIEELTGEDTVEILF